MAALILEAFAPDMILAIACLAAETRVLAMAVTALAFVSFRFEHLA